VGQKINPISARLGITRSWDSRWFTTKNNYADFLHEDIRLRDLIRRRFYHAGVSNVLIERAGNRAKITISTARPGIIIGPKGSEIENLRKDLEARTGKTVTINIEEVKRTEMSAQLVSENIAGQLMRRIGFRRAMKKTMQATMDAGALGIRIACSGRLGGAEMSRYEWYRKGRVPLHTLRADIDYGFAEAKTKFGIIGIKVWIFKGEVFRETKKVAEARKANR
jgi:small subunit ribosomal protein S3